MAVIDPAFSAEGAIIQWTNRSYMVRRSVYVGKWLNSEASPSATSPSASGSLRNLRSSAVQAGTLILCPIGMLASSSPLLTV